MPSINVLTINRQPENELDLVKIVEEARSYFPTEIWNDIFYLGKLSLSHDVKITTRQESFGALLFEEVLKKIEKIKDSDRLVSLLIGITPDPIVALYHFFDGKNFKRTLYLVHDYVTEKVGVVSFFQLNEKTSAKVVAHGLGHNRGLRHHVEPIDLMCSELLRIPKLQVDGFCKVCVQMLTKTQMDTEHASLK